MDSPREIDRNEAGAATHAATAPAVEAVEPWVLELLDHLDPGALDRIAGDPGHAFILAHLPTWAPARVARA